MKTIIRFFLCVVFAAAALAVYGLYSFESAGELAKEKTIFFERGSGFKAITQRLADEGVIREPWSLRVYAWVTGDYKKLQAGEYEFAAGMSAQGVLEKMRRGEQVKHKITIPEGLAVAEIMALLAKEDMLSGEVQPTIAEGSLLPETYIFLRGDSRASIVAAMQRDMQRTLAAMWATRQPNLPLASPQEALVLASMVEKETGANDERGKVAGVFVNRLRQGMKLQSDPTTAYAVTLADGPMNRSLTYDDLKRELPHNTYYITGLPPTPIACPGKAAIAAALNPTPTDALYFVADGAGGHRFAATMKEHEANVAMYRQWQASQPH